MSPQRPTGGDGGRDERLEALLRDALDGEAATVHPSGDGLSRIQSRLGRRRRHRWFGAAAAGMATLALFGVASAVYVAGRDTGDDRVHIGATPTSDTPPTTPPASPSPTSTSEPVAQRPFPRLAIFPFTVAPAARAWNAAYTSDGTGGWRADPSKVALTWVGKYLGQPAVDQVVQTAISASGERAAVTLGRTTTAEQQRTIPVTVVHLTKYADAWIVTGATDPQDQLQLTSPQAGATVSSPMMVAGPGYGVDESVQVEVREPSAATQLGHDYASFGQGTPTWSKQIAFSSASGGVGVVVVTEASAADGGPQRIVAEQVRLTGGSAPDVPAYFYAVKDGRVAQFSSRDGAALRYLTDAQPGGGASDPQLVGNAVYYLQGGGTCVNALMSVPVDGGQPQQVAAPDQGYVLGGYGVSADGTRLALTEEACAGASPQQLLYVADVGGGHRTVLDRFPAEPPLVVGDPAWSPAGDAVEAFVRGGNFGSVTAYDVATGKTETACRQVPAQPSAPVDVAGSGAVWTTSYDGSTTQVVECHANGPVTEFSVGGDSPPTDIALSGSGAALLTDSNGNLWRWDGSGDPVQLHPSVPLQQVTW